jgi:adenine phosphoribosyltransferase
MSNADKLKAAIRDVPDFPKPGIIFKDITPILGNPELFKLAVDTLADRQAGKGIRKVAAIDARGFIFGAAIAYRLGVGMVPIRKKGKLPFTTHEEACVLEYGTAVLAVHTDAFAKNEPVLLVDDLLATGGTAAAAARLIGKAGGKVKEVDFLIELTFLHGREKLTDFPVFSTIQF